MANLSPSRGFRNLQQARKKKGVIQNTDKDGRCVEERGSCTDALCYSLRCTGYGPTGKLRIVAVHASMIDMGSATDYRVPVAPSKPQKFVFTRHTSMFTSQLHIVLTIHCTIFVKF